MASSLVAPTSLKLALLLLTLGLLPSARAQVQTVATPSNQFGVVVGAKGTVYVTQDGGFTWKQEKLELDNNLDLTSAVAFEEESAIAIGGSCAQSYSLASCGIYRRQAGAPAGSYWQRIALDTTVQGVLSRFNAISFCNYTHGVIVGNRGLILRTEYNGRSWKIVQSDTVEDLLSIECHGGIAITCGTNSKVLRSTDGGRTWSSPSIPATGQTFSSLVMRNNVTAIALGQTEAYFTSDSGFSWQRMNSNITLPVFSSYTSYAESSPYAAAFIGNSPMVEVMSSGYEQLLQESTSIGVTSQPFPATSFSGKSVALPGLLQDCVGCKVIFLGGVAPAISNQACARGSAVYTCDPTAATQTCCGPLQWQFSSSSEFQTVVIDSGSSILPVGCRALNDCVQLSAIAFSKMASSGLKNPEAAVQTAVPVNGVSLIATVEQNVKFPFQSDVFGRQVENLLNMSYRPSVTVISTAVKTIDVNISITDQHGDDYVAKVKLFLSLAEASESSESSICMTGIRRLQVGSGAWGSAADVTVKCNGKLISDAVAIFLIVFFSVYGLAVISMAILFSLPSFYLLKKDFRTSILLWLFFGLFGVHRFYLKSPRMGLVWMFTAGMCGLGWILDLFLLPGLFQLSNADPNLEEHAQFNSESIGNAPRPNFVTRREALFRMANISSAVGAEMTTGDLMTQLRVSMPDYGSEQLSPMLYPNYHRVMKETRRLEHGDHHRHDHSHSVTNEDGGVSIVV